MERDGSLIKSCIPQVDCTNPYQPGCNCSNCQIEKNGLLSVAPDSTCCICIPSWIGKLLTGAADVFLTPWLLVLHYMRIYFIPAVLTTVSHLIERFICAFNCCRFGYTDYSYPPNDRSIGLKKPENTPHTVENLDMWHRGIFYALCGCMGSKDIEWIRAKDLGDAKDSEERVQLFKGDIDPADIYQGGLGDCWLLASLSAIAERHPELIRDSFLTGRVSLCGYYKIKLFDIVNGTPRWKVITIDDNIPVDSNKKPMYSQPKDNELWVLLMEKAFSKILGSYSFLKGGFSRIPFAALTGNDPIEYKWSSNCYTITNTSGGTDSAIAPRELTVDQMYHVIERGITHDLIITVGVSEGVQGLVSGHMYAILNACTHTPSGGNPVHLVQMRNPWGTEGEWKGPYSDRDFDTKGWKPDSGFVIDVLGTAKKGVENATEDDGLFWMPLDDLARRAHGLICLCAVSDSMATTRLNMHEDFGECGPCYGAMEGGCEFCCMCKGVSHLWCPQRRSTADMVRAYSEGNTLAALGCDKC